MSDDFNFTIVPAVRQAVPPLISLWSKSGDGKTYSGLLLARGLVGPTGKIVVIDTENGRAKFYSDVAAPWHHMDFQPPFTPDRYSAAFAAAEAAGADVIIVDSGSHVWEGEGGVLDMAENAKSSKGRALTGLAKFKTPKMSHKRMQNRLTRSAIPVIFCLRAKDAVKQIGGGDNAEIISLGWQPIAEKNFVFEMTLDLHMVRNDKGDAGYYDLATSKTVPEGLRSIVIPGARVSTEMGRRIAEWMGGGAAVDPEYIKLKRDGQDAAMQGADSYIKWKDALSATQKERIRHHHKEWTAIAKDADAESEPAATGASNSRPGADTSFLDDKKTDPNACQTCGGRQVVEDAEGIGPCPTCVPPKPVTKPAGETNENTQS